MSPGSVHVLSVGMVAIGTILIGVAVWRASYVWRRTRQVKPTKPGDPILETLQNLNLAADSDYRLGEYAQAQTKCLAALEIARAAGPRRRQE
ncbi:hypothetical protein [Variovorax sp. Sphag1AA]|uniref:hypothetical protein n=1 Tax=Variovorax sp. Sphag1AA TaxID=2587027 RepID=UPI001622E08A|nr:hypothetical protein [Variovorax sp. Sphag1AA]MBB3181790.1 hypothetical protein [Variovorax sp. Sphag1AA]